MNWKVRPDGISSPANNHWLEANCEVSEMELRLTHDKEGWHSTEVEAPYLGPGIYKFEVESDVPFNSWDPHVVFGAFLWGRKDDTTGEELDFEVSAFGDPSQHRLALGHFPENKKDWIGKRVRLPWNQRKLSGTIGWYPNGSWVMCTGKGVKTFSPSNDIGQTFRFNLWHQPGIPDDAEPVTVRVRFSFMSAAYLAASEEV
jgi:hypothetical protein